MEVHSPNRDLKATAAVEEQGDSLTGMPGCVMLLLITSAQPFTQFLLYSKCSDHTEVCLGVFQGGCVSAHGSDRFYRPVESSSSCCHGNREGQEEDFKSAISRDLLNTGGTHTHTLCNAAFKQQ